MCVHKQVASSLRCIKVSSFLACWEKQRAGSSLRGSALPWATYQTAWRSVGMCVCVCVYRKQGMQIKEWVVVKSQFSMLI